MASLAGPPLPVALLLVGLSGAGASYSLLARVAFVRGVAGPYRGRAFAIAAAGVTSGQGLGVAAAGGVSAVTSPAVAVGAVGALGLVLVGLALLASGPAGPALASPGVRPEEIGDAAGHSYPDTSPASVTAPVPAAAPWATPDGWP